MEEVDVTGVVSGGYPFEIRVGGTRDERAVTLERSDDSSVVQRTHFDHPITCRREKALA